MMELTKERLMALSNRDNVGPICSDEIAEMARQLLAGMEQEPVAEVPEVPELSKVIYHFRDWNEGFPVERFKADYVISWMLANYPPAPPSAAPQLPQPTVPSAMTPVIVDGEIIAYERHGERFSTIVGATWNACRAAMLQGAEPVSQRDELQVIVLHMGQAMSVFEALKKELISEHVRHAELGAMGAVNVQTWTSVIAGISLQYEASNGGCSLRVIPAAPKQEEK